MRDSPLSNFIEVLALKKLVSMTRNEDLFTIREMTIEDYNSVLRVWKEAGIDIGLSDTMPEIKRMIDHNPGLCLVLEDKEAGEIIGAVLGGFDGRRGWVHHLAVLPKHQRKGLGKKIMDELEKRFKAMNVVKIKLEVVQGNQGVVDFYEKLGWDLRDELITMSKTLRKQNRAKGA